MKVRELEKWLSEWDGHLDIRDHDLNDAMLDELGWCFNSSKKLYDCEEIKRENQELLECIEWIASHSVPRHYIMCDAYIIVKDHARRYMERLGKEFL